MRYLRSRKTSEDGLEHMLSSWFSASSTWGEDSGEFSKAGFVGISERALSIGVDPLRMLLA